jgi:gentisate 1,2-dioxygenase
MTAAATPPNADRATQDEQNQRLVDLYRAFDEAHMIPLWTQIEDLMPPRPMPKAQPHVWRWNELYPLAQRSGELVPVGRGGERRAIALANPGLGGHPYTTPTLWAAIQYLGPHEVAPEHRHTQNAFRFVLEGEGVWTVVDGDPVAMRRGDFLLTAGWHFHGHQNVTDAPMAWLDGLDIPLVYQTDSSFFEFGSETLTDSTTPEYSRSERLWAYPGLQPVAQLGKQHSSPIAAYRWDHTHRALTNQLVVEEEGFPATIEPGHAAVRYSNPTTGGDVLPTIRAEFHRLRGLSTTAPRREVGSSVWQVFSGRGTAVINGTEHPLDRGDIFVVPSWAEYLLDSNEDLDLFRFSDAPLFEALHLERQMTGRETDG